MNPEVSIIIPVYNAEKWLDRCIGSVLNQSFENWELILIDDGSKDESLAICAKYAEADNRIRIFSQENSGPSKARNRGIKESRGKYIMFVDSDDYISENCLSNLLNYEGEDWIIGGITHVYATGKIVNKPYVSDDISYSGSTFFSGVIYGDYNNVFLSPCSKLYKTAIIKDNNLFFDERLKYGEDQIFNQSYLNYCKSFTITHYYDYYYTHCNPSSLTSKIVNPELLFEYNLRMIEIRRDLARNRHNTNRKYNKYIRYRCTFHFWESVNLVYRTYPVESQKRKDVILSAKKSHRFTDIHNIGKLPVRYRLIQIFNMVFPFCIADKLTSIISI